MSFKTDYLCIDLDSNGCITSIYDITNDAEYFSSGDCAPLLRIASGDGIQEPEDMTFTPETNSLQLHYRKDVIAQIAVNIKPTHITFELKSLTGEDARLVMWGGYPTTIDQTVGETIGVVRDDQFAFGIQTLNIQTIGGRPRRTASSSIRLRGDAMF